MTNIIGVVGHQGKMGQEILQVLQEQKWQAVAIDRKAISNPSKKLKTMSGIIDFSSPAGMTDSLALAKSLGISFVSGTTGISEGQHKQLKAAAKKIPIIWAPNMSLGVAVLKKALENFAALNGFDFQIEEFHHRFKKDQPSGTAKALQAKLQSVLSQKQRKNLPQPISVRAGGIYGIHRVFAVSGEELLCFEHQALNRKVFAAGAVRAIHWLTRKKPGLYSIEDTLGE